ncbi:hypothetical protein [Algoriphagus sp. Y33]|uniref:hypothetical protein n=1 Tax=Algoriphagus sp. Y33 TaxID=2772483 RepID=UPI00177FC9D7|nr:hypothetical protein [Algoriphagus sp. Y33]
MYSISKIAGFISLILGFIFTFKPDILAKIQLSVDPNTMIEIRVKWGLLIGLGIFLLGHNNWTLWLTITGMLTALTLGVILARLMGLVMDGFFVKQIDWLLIELLALLVFGFLYWQISLK